MDADPAVSRPAHLPRDKSVVKQLNRHGFANRGVASEPDHRARTGQVDDPYDMVGAAQRQDRGL